MNWAEACAQSVSYTHLDVYKRQDSVSGVHDRMPLILEQEELENWLHDDDCLEFLLGRIPAALKKEQEYEQQALPFI